jgi:DNA-binding SARP family transcriptional activator
LDYATSQQLPIIWYRFDEGDADPATFFYYLRESMERLCSAHSTLPLLTPEYLAGLIPFTRKFFRAFNNLYTGKAIIVFDNYQDVPATADLHQFLPVGLMELGLNFTIFVASRQKPPYSYARLLLQPDMKQFGWNALKLDRKETYDICRAKLNGEPQSSLVDRYYEVSDGWISGLLLLLEKGINIDNVATIDIGQHDEIFNYFAGEIFRNLDDDTRKFLLYTSLFPKYNVSMAEKLLPGVDAGGICEYLVSHNYFTMRIDEPQPAYEYHPLFRAFLQKTAAQEISPKQLAGLHKNAVDILVEIDHINDAANLAITSENWEALTNIILGNAQELIEQGRYSLLHNWTSSLPELERDNNYWLKYWSGVAKIFIDPLSARTMLEQAYQQAYQQQDWIACAACWSDYVDTYVICWSEFFSLDPWLSDIQTLYFQIEADLPDLIRGRFCTAVFIAFMYRQPQNPHMGEWADTIRTIYLKTANNRLRLYIGAHLLMYDMWWIGDIARARALLDVLRPREAATNNDPFFNTLLSVMDAGLCWMIADNKEAINAAERGLALAADTGLTIWNTFTVAQATFGALSENDFQKAAEFIAFMQNNLQPSRYVDAAWLSYIKAWYEYALGNIRQAHAHLVHAKELIDQSGVYYFTAAVYNNLGKVLVEMGEPRQGYELIDTAATMGEAMGSATLPYLTWLFRSQLSHQAGDYNNAVACMKKSLSFARRYGLISHAWWSSEAMSQTYMLALENNVEVDYVTQIIYKRRLHPPHSASNSEIWPFPVKIYTLGRFALTIDGNAVNFEGKGRKKPFDLLKAIIAFGSQNVSDEKLSEALWPDADGDASYRSFKTTLYRLRKILAFDNVLTIQNGKISLNPHYCWVDIWSLEHLLNSLERSHELTRDELLMATDRALELYQGGFLEGENDDYWALTFRERLRSRWLRSLQSSTHALGKQGDCQRVIRLYQRALEIDPFSEELSRSLMSCYIVNGKHGEAVSLYHRCEKMLATMGLKPSAQTQNLLRLAEDGSDPAVLRKLCTACQTG